MFQGAIEFITLLPVFFTLILSPTEWPTVLVDVKVVIYYSPATLNPFSFGEAMECPKGVGKILGHSKPVDFQTASCIHDLATFKFLNGIAGALATMVWIAKKGRLVNGSLQCASALPLLTFTILVKDPWVVTMFSFALLIVPPAISLHGQVIISNQVLHGRLEPIVHFCHHVHAG